MKKVFITFGGPSEGYKRRVKELTEQAKTFHFFDEIIGLTDDYLYECSDFIDKHKKFLMNNYRGFGYWIWKSYIIKKTLERLNDGDILLYCDVGCILNIKGLDRLQYYFEQTNESSSGIFNFYLDGELFLEHKFTKNDIFEYLKCDETVRNSFQRIGTTFLIKKCRNSIDFVDEWYNVCCNYNLIDDSPSVTPNSKEFNENRHDQSILSCLSKKYNSIAIKDETYFISNWEIDGMNYPIWAVRKRG